jgi:DNA repair protein RecN (Recombination protein N)
MLEAARERRRRAETLDAQIARIDAVAPAPGEEDDLAAEARRLRNADRIAQGVAAALAALDDDAGGAVAALVQGRRALDDAARHDDRLAPLARDLAEALQGAQAVAGELQGFLDDVAADPARLDAVEARLTALQRLFAAYGDGSAAVLAYRDAVADERAGLDRSEDRIRELRARRDELDAALAARAAEVRAGREAAAARLAREAAPLLERLALPGARLVATLEPAELGPHGGERTRLDFAADPGEPLAPLAQAASGGELSRVMLALWLVTGSDRPSLVFDEVDAGVGGRAAAAVGELLAELARRHQVLVVTHLAQVAAHADRHVHVGKATSAGRTTTTVVPLESPEARERELARMLAGHEGEAARAAARELLARAGGGRAQPAASAARSASTSDTSE